MELVRYTVKALFEVSFCTHGNNYLIIYGKHINGYFCCIPNWKIGCEMAEPSDTFYNYERLCDAGLNDEAAKEIASMIKEVSAGVSE